MELVRIQKKNLPKKFKDNEVNLPNVPKEVVIQRIKLGHCQYKTLHPGIKFGVMQMFTSLDPTISFVILAQRHVQKR